jgi:hypothetical protein
MEHFKRWHALSIGRRFSLLYKHSSELQRSLRQEITAFTFSGAGEGNCRSSSEFHVHHIPIIKRNFRVLGRPRDSLKNTAIKYCQVSIQKNQTISVSTCYTSNYFHYFIDKVFELSFCILAARARKASLKLSLPSFNQCFKLEAS